MLPSSQHLGGHSLGSLQCVRVCVLLGSPHLDTVVSPELSRGEWNDDLELLAALLTQPRDEQCSVRAEAEELCSASAAPHQHFPSPCRPQVRLCCPLSSGAECSAVCSLPSSCSCGTCSAIPLLSVLWWPDAVVPIGLPVPERLHSLPVRPGGAVLQNTVEPIGRFLFHCWNLPWVSGSRYPPGSMA